MIDNMARTFAEVEAKVADIRRAGDLYRSDDRFRRIVDVCVSDAMHQNGPTDELRPERHCHRVATDACAVLLATIYHRDAELKAARERINEMTKAYEKMINTKPLSLVMDPPQ